MLYYARDMKEVAEEVAAMSGYDCGCARCVARVLGDGCDCKHTHVYPACLYCARVYVWMAVCVTFGAVFVGNPCGCVLVCVCVCLSLALRDPRVIARRHQRGTVAV